MSVIKREPKYVIIKTGYLERIIGHDSKLFTFMKYIEEDGQFIQVPMNNPSDDDLFLDEFFTPPKHHPLFLFDDDALYVEPGTNLNDYKDLIRVIKECADHYENGSVVYQNDEEVQSWDFVSDLAGIEYCANVTGITSLKIFSYEKDLLIFYDCDTESG
jgi:hypothetical protein